MRVQRKATKSLDGRVVLIERGDNPATAATATIGETRSEDFVEDGNTVLTVRFRDWLIDAVEYKVNGEAAIPAEGDRVIYDREIWTVHVTPSEPEHRRSDRDSQTWRVHCKKTGTR